MFVFGVRYHARSNEIALGLFMSPSPSPNPLLLLGLIQDLQKQAADLGLSRTAAALEVTSHVATDELSDLTTPPAVADAEAKAGEADPVG